MFVIENNTQHNNVVQIRDLWHPWKHMPTFEKQVFRLIAEYDDDGDLLFDFAHYALAINLPVSHQEQDMGICFAFVSACRLESVEYIQSLFDCFQVLEKKDEHTWLKNAFVSACKGNLPVLKFLVSKMPNVSQTIQNMKEKPLDVALTHGGPDIFDYLFAFLDPQAQSEFFFSNQYNRLYCKIDKAIRSKSVDMVRHVIEYLLESEVKWEPSVSMHSAVWERSRPIFEYLMSLQTTNESQDIIQKHVGSFLHTCMVENDFEMFTYIVSLYEGDPLENDEDIVTDIARFAADFERMDFLQYVFSLPMTQELSMKCKHITMYEAIDAKNNEILQYLLSIGSPVENKRNAYACKATRHGKLDMLKYLVKAGLQVTNYNNELMYIALAEEHVDIVKYLISLGIRFNCDDAIKASQYHLSVERYMRSNDIRRTFERINSQCNNL